MFVQVMKGKTSNPAKLRSQAERWQSDVRPGAVGFLGATGGIADDGTFILFARFADEAAARANSNRAEQNAWWEETIDCFDGEPTFRESSDIRFLLEGGSDDAGFVQVMEGRAVDRAKAEAFESPELLEQLRAARPELLGGMRAWFDGGAFAEVVYFTSEENARKGESSSDFAEPQQEYQDLYQDTTFIDLRDPILNGP
jgi:hypothetical protein